MDAVFQTSTTIRRAVDFLQEVVSDVILVVNKSAISITGMDAAQILYYDVLIPPQAFISFDTAEPMRLVVSLLILHSKRISRGTPFCRSQRHEVGAGDGPRESDE